jgi:hypothetical protein
MRHPIHEIWRDTYFDVIEEWCQRYGNGHLEIRKMKIKEANLFNTVGWTLVWPHDVECFQGSTFCLFVMVQPWNIGVYWIDQVFVTELTVVIFFCSCSRFEYKKAFNLVKIHLLFRIIPLIQWSVMFCRPCSVYRLINF